MTRRRLPPGLVLFLLAPVIAELLSGSTPPLLFFHPILLAINVAIYGSGALLIREFTLRWHKGWPTILCLGAAYGILEEGLAIRSFFNPRWPDVGTLGVVGRSLGVNWLWTAQLMLQHAVVSIAIPILIVTILYADRRDEPWVGNWTRRLLWVPLAAASFVLFRIFPYSAPLGPYVFWAGIAIALVVLARLVPRHLLGQDGDLRADERPHWAIWYAVVGFAGVVGMYGLPHVQIPGVAAFALVWGAAAAVGFVVVWLSRRGRGWDDTHRMALVSGALGFYIFLSPLRALHGSPASVLVGLAGLGFLIWLNVKVRRPRLAPLTMELAGR